MHKIVVYPMLLSLWSMAALAHHGNAEFDLGAQRRYQGTLTDVLWRNPHIVLTLATQSEDGKAISLEIEGASPNILRVGGFGARTLAAGETVTALVSPSRRHPEASAYGYEIVKADGTVVPLVSARLKRPPTSQRATTIYGTWVATAESFTRLVRGLRNWPLNDDARGIRSRFTPKASGQARCVPVAAPMLMTYPVVTEFEQHADHITIASEWLGAERTVYTDGRAHPLTGRFQQGHSVGHWEGDVLVVDTTNFTDQETGGIPSGGNRHLVERFALSEDGGSLGYDYDLRDPDYLTGAVTGHADLVYRPDLSLTGADCDPALARRFFREFE